MNTRKTYWLQQSAADIPESMDWLHEKEKGVLSTFKFSKRRNDWLLGRWTAKNAVKLFYKNSLPDFSFEGIEIRAASDGAPEVFRGGIPMPVLISLSHSHGVGFCLVTSPDKKPGCDLERIEARSEAFVSDYFTLKEQEILFQSDKKDHAVLANAIWSAKESMLKATRLGLSIDTRRVEVELSTANGNFERNDLQVTMPKTGVVFSGYWWVSEGFVFTVLWGK